MISRISSGGSGKDMVARLVPRLASVYRNECGSIYVPQRQQQADVLLSWTSDWITEEKTAQTGKIDVYAKEPVRKESNIKSSTDWPLLNR